MIVLSTVYLFIQNDIDSVSSIHLVSHGMLRQTLSHVGMFTLFTNATHSCSSECCYFCLQQFCLQHKFVVNACDCVHCTKCTLWQCTVSCLRCTVYKEIVQCTRDAVHCHMTLYTVDTCWTHIVVTLNDINTCFVCFMFSIHSLKTINSLVC